MYIVFLNMADTQHALSNKSVRALQRKYPAYSGWNPYNYYVGNNCVEEIDLIPLYRKWKSGPRDRAYLDAMNRVRLSCAKADKLMLGVHGTVGNTETASIEDFGHASVSVTCQDLATFFLGCLPATDSGWWFLPGSGGTPKRYHVALIMCFGARSQNHLADHAGILSPEAIRSSFAYKFYRLVCRQRIILMTARTGSVSFDENTGRSLVQTEEAVLAEAEYNDLQAAISTKMVAELNERLWERATREERRDLVQQRERIEQEIERGRTDWSMASPAQMILVRYALLRKRTQELTQAKDPSIAKHGKFVFLYDSQAQSVTVVRKYPVRTVIYQGAL